MISKEEIRKNMDTPGIIYLVRDREDLEYITWQSDQPADDADGIEYIRTDCV